MTVATAPASAPLGVLTENSSVQPSPAEAGVDGTKLSIRKLNVFYGSFRAVRDVSLEVRANSVTAIIGPSGSGKSTLLRSINRMTDLVPRARAEGEVMLEGTNVLDPQVDVVEVRRRVGMVFQRPNPFPKSIFDNVAYGPRLYGVRGKDLTDTVEQALRSAALWDEVHDKLRQSGLALSGGQQQRLCIARAIAVEPDVILMDELMSRLKSQYTIMIVTHNMQQAARVSDETAFLNMGDDRAGYLVEVGPTPDIFTNPKNQLTEDYVSGRFG
jgi:phosphate transport system ATP-binding protein